MQTEIHPKVTIHHTISYKPSLSNLIVQSINTIIQVSHTIRALRTKSLQHLAPNDRKAYHSITNQNIPPRSFFRLSVYQSLAISIPHLHHSQPDTNIPKQPCSLYTPCKQSAPQRSHHDPIQHTENILHTWTCLLHFGIDTCSFAARPLGTDRRTRTWICYEVD